MIESLYSMVMSMKKERRYATKNSDCEYFMFVKKGTKISDYKSLLSSHMVMSVKKRGTRLRTN